MMKINGKEFHEESTFKVNGMDCLKVTVNGDTTVWQKKDKPIKIEDLEGSDNPSFKGYFVITFSDPLSHPQPTYRLYYSNAFRDNVNSGDRIYTSARSLIDIHIVATNEFGSTESNHTTAFIYSDI